MGRKWCFNCGRANEGETICAICRRRDKAYWIPDTAGANTNMDIASYYPSHAMLNIFKQECDNEILKYCKADVQTTKALYEPSKLYALEQAAKEIGCRVVAESWFRSVNMPGIEKVIFNDPATIVIWDDGTKTVVKAQGDDIFDPEKGLAMAVSKKALGNKGNYFEEFKKWLPEEKDVVAECKIAHTGISKNLTKLSEEAVKTWKALEESMTALGEACK